MSPRLVHALQAIDIAGQRTLELFEQGISYEVKTDNSPVTEADKAAERLIREFLGQHYPGESILGEEEGLSGHGDTRWIIDPIDGTKSFVAGVPLFANLLSYEVEGKTQLAVANFPALNQVVYAELGQGAYCNKRPIKVSDRNTVEGAILLCGGHKSMAENGRAKPFDELAKRAMATRTWGDAYGHALIARGLADAFADPTVNRWDVSSMSLIVTEAGGRFTRFDGGDWSVSNHSDGKLEALSTNGHLHEELMRVFA